ncbi:hypothetical protein IME_066 [Enterococcus phage IME-EFm1]|uniref:Uncharacterized protein n=2 Tax=Efemunavirus TaxID=3153270 RepID=A0A976SGB1_9CAUD|nr:hypothetical protein IME_066 [Enterococcus phage IME-EFm1]AIA65133.1 hypothetical protein IME_066 [Enterococcus phage IME-EFm1]UUW40514.1 hypothetical protein [Enterococcus phage vB_Efm_LG62]
MKTIEITLDLKTNHYSILEDFGDNTVQGLTTNDIEEAKEYITNILESL